MEAILQAGFDDDPAPASPSEGRTQYNVSNHHGLPPRPYQQYNNTPRYEPVDSAPSPRFNGYAPQTHSYGQVPPPPPRERVISPTSPFRPVDGTSSAVEQWKSHAKKRSIGRNGNGPGGSYGPLGPLGPGS